MTMTPIETEAQEYLLWLRVHNYADTTIAGRVRYLEYFTSFCHQHGVDQAEAVAFELLQAYQHQLFEHRKRDGQPLSFATQAQRLVPVAHFFTWLRRSGRLAVNPASDLLMPKPDRRLPEATLSASEMNPAARRARHLSPTRTAGPSSTRGLLLDGPAPG